MKIIRRQLGLLQRIRENPHANLKELGEELGVSLQTVRSDLMSLQEIMEEYHVQAEILPGGDLRLWGQENMNYMIKALRMMQDFSLEKQLLLLMAFQEGFVVLQDLADALYVSKSLVEKVMSVILKQYPDEIEGVRRHGIRNIAGRLERRSRMAQLLAPYISGLDFPGEMEAFHLNHFPILDYIDRQEVQRTVEAVKFLNGQRSFSFTDEALANLMLQLSFAQSCHRRWQKVRHGSLERDMLEDMPNVAEYRRMAGEVCKRADLSAEEEQDYFSYLFLMLRKQAVSDADTVVQSMEEVVGTILLRIFERYAIDLRDDDELLKGLSVHLYSTIVRRDRLGTELAEDDIRETCRQYPLGYEMAATAAGVVGESCSYEVSRMEIMYMTLHFQAAIERMKDRGRKVKVIVVCHYGMAAASLISVQAARAVPGLDIIGSMSMQRFLDMPDCRADLVLSTENIPEGRSPLPALYVTPLLPEQELKQIRRFVELKSAGSLLPLYLQNAIVIDLPEAPSRKAVLEKAAGLLQESGMVTEEYLPGVLLREKISATDLEGIAVPHGNPDHVLQTQLVVLRLAKAVDWGRSPVQLVFLFAVSKEDFSGHFALFSGFYKRLARREIRAALLKMMTHEQGAFKRAFMHLLSQ